MQEDHTGSVDQDTPLQEERATSTPDTKHEPHAHAKRRLLVGAITLLVALLAFFTWVQYGESIQEWCTGESGACSLELEELPPEGAVFDQPTGF